VPWNDLAAIHSAVQNSDMVLIGGGGLFHDYWGADPDTFLTGKHWGVSYYAGPALLATLYRKRLMLYSVGVGPLSSAHGSKLTRTAAQAAHAITVRDSGSKTLLEGMGIPAARIRVTADPAVAFRPTGTLGPSSDLRRPILGVAARYWGIGVHPDLLERELAGACDLFLERTGGTVVLVPFQQPSGDRENDAATAARILERMRNRERAVLAGAATPDEVYGWLKDCGIVLGMRLHALIFAASAGVPTVSLNYDPTIAETVQRLGAGHIAMDLKDCTAPTLVSQLIQAVGRRLELPPDLRNAATHNTSIALSLLDNPVPEGRLDPDSFDLLARSLSVQSQAAVQPPAPTATMAEPREIAELRDQHQAAEEESSLYRQRLAETIAQ
jgi:polysaccharide pyruvyl transferase CsaB